MKYSMFALLTVSAFVATDVLACDGVHPTPECPRAEAPAPTTTPELKVPVLKVTDGGYASGSNCFLALEVVNNDETNAVNYQVELRKLGGEWIALPTFVRQKKLVHEMSGEFASTDLELRARSQGIFVMPYDAKPMAKFSEFTDITKVYCQGD